MYKLQEINRFGQSRLLFRTIINSKKTENLGVNKDKISPIPVAAPSKPWVCGRSLDGIAGSNQTGCILCLSCECCAWSLRRADHLSKGLLPTVVCLSVIVKHRIWGGPGPLGAVETWKWGGPSPVGAVKTWKWGSPGPLEVVETWKWGGPGPLRAVET
jgi:hypothetical protein